MTTLAPGPERFLSLLGGFVAELRRAGLPVSMAENLDALRAMAHVGIDDRPAFRNALAATLVKHVTHRAVFDIVFDVYFALLPSLPLGDADPPAGAQGSPTPGAGGGAGGEADDLAVLLLAAILDSEALRRFAATAVDRHAGMEPGRPVGGTYYLYRTMRALEAEALVDRLLARLGDQGGFRDELAARLAREELELRVRRLKEEVEAEIRRRLVADRGPEALARSLRAKLPEDIDFMHASAEEMAAIARAVDPLARALAARLAMRRRHRRRGQLDFRATARRSLAFGGVPAEPRFRKPHPSKPEIMVVADISGSVANFARFTFQLVHALASRFSRVRSFCFIDGLDEVTRFLEPGGDVSEAIRRINTEANVLWVDGHSDYGHALTVFHETFAAEVTSRTTVMILGDARNNYHATGAWVLADVSRRARHLYWLDPEARAYWDTGDSVVSEYARYCDGVWECRNLRQLERFVASVIDR